MQPYKPVLEVYLIDEPVAAAIGTDSQSEPIGRMIIDIGGGTELQC